jgi:hypothetical protein
LNNSDSQTERFGNVSDKSIYGTNQVGSAVIDGVDLVDSETKAGFGGAGRDGQVGYAYSSPIARQAAITAATSKYALKATFLLDGAVSDANKKMLKYDPDLLSITDSSLRVAVVDLKKSECTSADGDPDFENLSAFSFENAVETSSGTTDNSNLETILAITLNTAGEKIEQIRRLTQIVAAGDSVSSVNAESVRFIFVTNESTALSTYSPTLGNIALGDLEMPAKDQIDASSNTVGAVVGDLFPLEGSSSIPEIDIKVDSTAITAQTKKLKAKWTPELGQDLNAYHNLDAEVELTSILSEQIALEIDREILADLVNGATAGTYYWSRSPGLFVDKVSGAELGATAAAPDFTGTVSEWYETLIETINDVSAQIHRKTLRGGANFVIVSPEVANILEFTSGFRANVTADADKGDIGAVKVGSLSRKFDVIVDPYFPRNVLLVGRKGNSFLESGYVYAPYVPLQTTPTIFDPESFVPRKGVMTRYAKKMVRPDMYGLVIVRGLLGEEGSS